MRKPHTPHLGFLSHQVMPLPKHSTGGWPDLARRPVAINPAPVFGHTRGHPESRRVEQPRRIRPNSGRECVINPTYFEAKLGGAGPAPFTASLSVSPRLSLVDLAGNAAGPVVAPRPLDGVGMRRKRVDWAGGSLDVWFKKMPNCSVRHYVPNKTGQAACRRLDYTAYTPNW